MCSGIFQGSSGEIDQRFFSMKEVALGCHNGTIYIMKEFKVPCHMFINIYVNHFIHCRPHQKMWEFLKGKRLIYSAGAVILKPLNTYLPPHNCCNLLVPYALLQLLKYSVILIAVRLLKCYPLSFIGQSFLWFRFKLCSIPLKELTYADNVQDVQHTMLY